MNSNMIVKIGDFGVSKQLKSYKTYALTRKKLGTEYYAAPEIVTKGIYNEKSDIWSLGCIIYELLTLNTYYKDKLMDEIKQIDSNLYNNKKKEYTIIKEIGKGGFGRVLQILNKSDGKYYAIKEIPLKN